MEIKHGMQDVKQTNSQISLYSLSPKPQIATNRVTWVRLCAGFQKGERLYDHRRRIVKEPAYLIRKLCHLSSHSLTYPRRMEL